MAPRTNTRARRTSPTREATTMRMMRAEMRMQETREVHPVWITISR
jgi:hypothetical protein